MLTRQLLNQLRNGLSEAYENLIQDERFQNVAGKDYLYIAESVYSKILTNIDNPKEYIESIKPAISFNELDHQDSVNIEGDIWMKTYGKLSINPELIINVPTHNEGITVVECIKAILLEVKKSNRSVLLQIIVNGSTDETYENIRYYLDNLMIPLNLQVDLVESQKDISSLPAAINFTYKYSLTCYDLDLNNTYLSTVDGDAIILNNKKRSHFDILIEELNKSGALVVSGQSTDLRNGLTSFHDFANLSCRPEVVSILNPKPYTHGGGGALIIRLRDFPKDLLKADDLGGISLSIYVHRDIDINELNNRDCNNWITKTMPNLLVSHPTRTNIIDWLVTYANYAKFRNKAKIIVNHEILDLWEEARSRSKDLQDDILYGAAGRYFTIDDFAGYLLIKKYLFKFLIYENPIDITILKNMSPRAHKNV